MIERTMKPLARWALGAFAAAGLACAVGGPATAAPLAGIGQAVPAIHHTAPSLIENVRDNRVGQKTHRGRPGWHNGPRWRGPHGYYRPYYRPRPFYRPYGYYPGPRCRTVVGWHRNPWGAMVYGPMRRCW